MPLQIFKGNTSPAISDTIAIDGAPVDLTGATVFFQMREPTTGILEVNNQATITSALNGAVRYDWAAPDVDTAGEYDAWWSVHFPSGAVQDTPEFEVEILEHAEVSGNLCTVFDVRQAMGLMQASTGSDDQIREYIREASDQIKKVYAREFSPPVSNQTRRYPLRGRVVDFYPDDLRNVTSIRINPDVNGGFLLDASQYELRPLNSPEGVYTNMRISPWISTVSNRQLLFGYSYVDVTGDWGFATVPQPVKRAAVIAVRSWLRRDSTSFSNVPGYTGGDIQPTATGTWSLPYASHDLLKPYKRWAGFV
jgi:hypothetical protein